MVAALPSPLLYWRTTDKTDGTETKRKDRRTPLLVRQQRPCIALPAASFPSAHLCHCPTPATSLPTLPPSTTLYPLSPSSLRPALCPSLPQLTLLLARLILYPLPPPACLAPAPLPCLYLPPCPRLPPYPLARPPLPAPCLACHPTPYLPHCAFAAYALACLGVWVNVVDCSWWWWVVMVVVVG